MNSAHDFVKYAVSIGAIELVPEGRTLKSGRRSPYFFNSGLFNTAQSIDTLAMAYVRALEGSQLGERSLLPDVIFGPAYKGITLAVMVAYFLSLNHDNYNPGIAYNRKEAKDHGEGGVLIGAPLQGKRVLIVDDVITDGASKREAVEIIRAHGGTPIGCVIAFDRQERGPDENDPRSGVQRFQEESGIPVLSAASLDVLVSVLKHSEIDQIRPMFNKIQTYREQYGV